MSGRTFFVGGNFKMNGTQKSIRDIIGALNDAKLDDKAEVVIAPPSIYLLSAREHLRKDIQVAAQNVFDKPSGAFTGEISIEQLKDTGVQWVILGHSERRTILQENDDFVASKVAHSLSGGVKVIFCCGDTLEQYEAGKTNEVVTAQVSAVCDKVKDFSHVVIAYEPIYAIGTGKAATPETAQATHSAIRTFLKSKIGAESDKIRIIYGGSVNGKNCSDYASCPDVDGFLVGGASLKPEFTTICNAKTKL
ncbi:Triosephosphate isomerase [Taphrina deformans PYCC 5710]|uniref:Triosephosphate isomerase n=1 Tax=Taphrina deformans (strain PYCC 5710 / ATCC 11124 / CBS 356.35 / IMI 108563 / JCM 9778 / NBRC 8474) TaxID=1097556 RepID=R4X748_TAPDE|nr:Triosephosphate isomerase [Taphrina deformans PYCC 5710]|eukprot:CCG81107.1 Triosephosphate isomerase [Taphrina deformans PYCC 5710]